MNEMLKSLLFLCSDDAPCILSFPLASAMLIIIIIIIIIIKQHLRISELKGQLEFSPLQRR